MTDFPDDISSDDYFFWNIEGVTRSASSTDNIVDRHKCGDDDDLIEKVLRSDSDDVRG